MYSDVIGIVGGMGSYATASFFKRLIDAFPVEKEWERPRIIIDNRCTMPSRVRAILYKEKMEELGALLAESVRNLIHSGATKIVLACNTSHFFLPYIYRLVPEAKGAIINIIEETCKEIEKSNKSSASLLASEGTIECGIFEEYLKDIANSDVITLNYPSGADFILQREIIEAVKQNCLKKEDVKKLIHLINSSKGEIVILGCTEFPIAFEHIPSGAIHKEVIDPLQCAINRIVKEIK